MFLKYWKMLLVKTTFDYAEERLRLEAITLEPTYIFELISPFLVFREKIMNISNMIDCVYVKLFLIQNDDFVHLGLGG